MATNKDANSRVFLYEVVIQPQIGELKQINGLIYRQGKLFLKVPYERMNQEMQRIQRLGGKIVSINPLGAMAPLTETAGNEVMNQHLALPWWVEISTTHPNCLYYFGPFDSREEALDNQAGYVEDLRGEGAQNITLYVKQCQPQILTQAWDEEG